MEDQFNALAKRLNRLEFLNRLLIGLLVVFSIGMVYLYTSSMDKEASVLKAEQIELIDAEGKVRAVMKTRDTDEVGLWIFNKLGEERIALSDGEEGSALYLKDGAGDIRVGVAQFAHGGGGFALHGEKGFGASVLYYKGKGSLSFYGDSSEVIHRIP